MTTLTNAEPVFSDTRIKSIDILRGIVMVLMAIDHIRVYSGIPSWSTDYGIFFTRWVTNFCAPTFTFLAGTSVFLYGIKLGNKSLLARYLFTRGLALVFLELTIIRFFWTFNLNYGDFLLAGIIWMLGWCMVIMAAVIWLKPITIGIVGLAVIFLQDIFGLLPKFLPNAIQSYAGYFREFLYPAGLHKWPAVTILYVIIPWIGVMMAGYGFGLVFLKQSAVRRKICLYTGLSAIILFIVIGWIVASRQTGDDMPFLLRLLSQRKYPASQLFLLMTLGPAILLLPFLENARGWAAKVFNTFGRVPFFYYILHILVIHLGALLVDYIREGVIFPSWYANAPFVELGPKHQWTLLQLYIEFFCDIAFLYWICSIYSRYKAEHPKKRWLQYL